MTKALYNAAMGLDLTTVLISVFALIVALTLHEFAHALMGHYLGDSTARDHGRLTINPIAHIDPFATLALPLLLILLQSPVVFGAAKPVPFNPWAVKGGRWGAALVATAGPFTNLLLAIFFSVWLRFTPQSIFSNELLGTFITVNVALFVFNMIPFPPLDGSRVLYAIAPAGLRNIMDRIERAGLMLIFVIMLVGYQFIGGFVFGVSKFIISLLVPVGPLP